MKSTLILAASIIAMATTANAEDWSDVDYNDYGTPYISATSSNDESAFIMLYAYPREQCEVSVSVIGVGDKPASIVGEYDVRVFFRIDKNPVISADTELEFENITGDDGQVRGYVSSGLLASDDFLAQFVTGRKLIYKVEVPDDGEEVIETTRWNLGGSSKALNKLLGACTRMAEDSNEWGEEQPAKWKRDSYAGDEWES